MGRELDRKIAEMMGEPIEPLRCGADYPKPYSTDIADAWSVVEWMERRRWESVEIGNCNAEWRCVFTLADGSRRGVGISTSPPEAICLAALEAMQGREGE